MNNGWLFSRLYACLLIMALPLLPAGDDQPLRSESSRQVAPLLDGDERSASFGGDTAPREDVVMYQTHPIRPQTGSHRLVVNAKSDAKRQQFTPWGGKRTLDDSVVWKRPKFQPWGGKRLARIVLAPSYANNRKSSYVDGFKREFHPWGGKRSV